MKKEEQTEAKVKLPPIPITVIAGFLGAGKTTLLHYILTAEHGRRIGVLVNDFGSINVDAELVTDVSDEMISLANGCICCTIRMDLIQAVLEMANNKDRPEHIVIESSGVADPAGIVKSFMDPEIWGTVQLDSVISLVDADQSLDLPDNEKRLARAQVVGGDIILLNKVDLVNAEKLAQVHEWIKSIKPGAQVFETTQARLPMKILLGTGLTDPKRFEAKREPEVGVHVHEVSEGHDHDHDHDNHAHGLLFDTWTYYSEEPLHMAYFQELLYNLPSTVFRAKGFVYSMQEPQTRMVVQVVGRRATITATRAWGDDKPQTRMVFISELGTVNYPLLKKVLDRCRVQVEV